MEVMGNVASDGEGASPAPTRAPIEMINDCCEPTIAWLTESRIVLRPIELEPFPPGSAISVT